MESAVYGFGSNSFWQLGNGTTQDAHSISESIILNPGHHTYQYDSVKTVACGANHSLLLTQNGILYGAGSNSYGQGCLSESFKRLALSDDAVFETIACGWNNSFAIDSSGAIWAFGTNSHGQLGRDQRSGSEARVVQLDNQTRPVKIALGQRHSLVLFEDGQVWGWGETKMGALGSAQGKSIALPSRLVLRDGTESFKDIAAGQYHSVVVTKQKSVVTLGSRKRNRFGQLGYSEPEGDHSTEPASDSIEHDVQLPTSHCSIVPTYVFSGWSHCAVVFNNGDCVMWGRADLGQIPCKIDPVPAFLPPVLVPALRKCKELCLGSESGMANLSDGRVCCWGWNEHGNCGNGSASRVFNGLGDTVSKSVAVVGTENRKVETIACGFGHGFVVMRVEVDLVTGTRSRGNV
ncbi:regulator of chromosome condensation 1/beta-lactamase-inhibitor protein II [Chytriomyces cf. hyalinus JEL632]|nr:regulator of chromosome condensation 1/beta-lactamase-inhibitor protein II [Chytriomyces cf. hyalinus JEL632]